MPRNDHDKRKSGGLLVADAPAPAPAPAPTPEPQPESLDKVRDILFGGQMRAVESRLQGLEERLRGEHEALRADFVKQVESLDAFIRSEVQLLGERLAAERAKRTEELKSLAAEIKETIRALEKRHVKLEEATNLADAGLRDQLLLQAERAAAELSELRSTKTDSAVLSGFLSELAARVGGGGSGGGAAPAKNGPRG